jgi:hypothetical protein
LVQLWQNEPDVKLISTILTAKIVETEEICEGEKKLKSETTADYNTFIRGVDRADAMVHIIQAAGKP